MRKKTIDTIPVLTEGMSEILNTFSKSRSIPSSLVQRANIVLLSACGESNQDIAAKVGLHYINVATWRNRFIQNIPNLMELETSDPKKLRDEIERILSDRERPGAPGTFTPEQIMKIINLACQDPRKYGHEVSHWSLPLLVDEIKRLGIADSISAKTVSRFLK